MRSCLILLVLASFLALANSQACSNGANTCLTKSQVNPGFWSYFNGGAGPCFSYTWSTGPLPTCFISANSISPCQCSIAACQCSSVPTVTTVITTASTTTLAGSQCSLNPGTPSNCATLKAPYCNIDAANTACKYCAVNMTTCNKLCQVGVTLQADKDLLVNLHNQYRRNVSKGLETRGAPGPQPIASNMRELVWDDELAYTAQILAEQCVFAHDSSRSTPNNPGWVGQNLASSSSSAFSSTRNYAGHVQMWYDEAACTPKTAVASFSTATTCTTGNTQIGHYTQLVWANTQKVGCGFVQYYSNGWYTQFTACNYWPGGNVLTQAMYNSAGSPASNCPTGTTVNNGLCK